MGISYFNLYKNHY